MGPWHNPNRHAIMNWWFKCWLTTRNCNCGTNLIIIIVKFHSTKNPGIPEMEGSNIELIICVVDTHCYPTLRMHTHTCTSATTLLQTKAHTTCIIRMILRYDYIYLSRVLCQPQCLSLLSTPRPPILRLVGALRPWQLVALVPRNT